MNGSQLTQSNRLSLKTMSSITVNALTHCFFLLKKNILSVLHFFLLESHPFLKPFDHTHKPTNITFYLTFSFFTLFFTE